MEGSGAMSDGRMYSCSRRAIDAFKVEECALQDAHGGRTKEKLLVIWWAQARTGSTGAFSPRAG